MKVNLIESVCVRNETINNQNYKIFEDRIFYYIEDNHENFPTGSNIEKDDVLRISATCKKKEGNRAFLSSVEWQYLD